MFLEGYWRPDNVVLNKYGEGSALKQNNLPNYVLYYIYVFIWRYIYYIFIYLFTSNTDASFWPSKIFLTASLTHHDCLIHENYFKHCTQ